MSAALVCAQMTRNWRTQNGGDFQKAKQPLPPQRAQPVILSMLSSGLRAPSVGKQTQRADATARDNSGIQKTSIISTWKLHGMRAFQVRSAKDCYMMVLMSWHTMAAADGIYTAGH